MVTMELRLKKAAINLERGRVRRENLIREAVAEGMSYRQIAEILGVTHQTVANILTRAG